MCGAEDDDGRTRVRRDCETEDADTIKQVHDARHKVLIHTKV